MDCYNKETDYFSSKAVQIYNLFINIKDFQKKFGIFFAAKCGIQVR
jgi:hypothetical protein